MRLILPGETRELKKGDVSNVGIDISTSCFGRSAVHIAPLIWRLVCSNGMRSMERGGGFSFRHVGDSDRLKTAVAEAIPTALVHARGVMTQWQKAVTFMVEDVQKQIEAMRELTIPERKGLENALLKETGAPELPEHVPLYDLVNAHDGVGEGRRPGTQAGARGHGRRHAQPACREGRMNREVLCRPVPAPRQSKTRPGQHGKTRLLRRRGCRHHQTERGLRLVVASRS